MDQLQLIFTILLTFFLIEGIRSQTDYCNRNLCRMRTTHITCNNNGTFGRACSSNARIIPILKDFRRNIVDTHNSLRNRIALGTVKGYMPAVRMGTMRWSFELASLAKLAVKRCMTTHDRCRNTDQFRFAGQNGARVQWRKGNHNAQTMALTIIRNWFKEYRNCSMNDIRNLRDISKCGRFTVMVQEKNVAVGCAILRQRKGGLNMQFMACNYAYNNIISIPVYRHGRATSKCTTGRNPSFKALCSIREEYNLKSTQF